MLRYARSACASQRFVLPKLITRDCADSRTSRESCLSVASAARHFTGVIT